MRFTFRLLTAIAVVAMPVGAADAAPILIDNFGTGSQTVNGGSSLNGSFTNVSGAGLLGTRSLTYQGTNAGTGNTFRTMPAETLALNNPGLPGRLALSTFDSAVQVNLSYGGFGVLNASGMGFLSLVFDTIFDPGIGGGFVVDLTLTTSTGNLTTAVIAPGGFLPSGGTLLIPLSSLTGPGSLSSVTGISVSLNDGGTPNAASDFALDQLAFVETPEPASMAVFGVLALGGGLAVARRRMMLAKSPATA